MPTYTYNITGDDNTAADIEITTAATATNDTGFGLGYDITSISGTFDGKTITGEFGSGGVTGTNRDLGSWDNVLFTTDSNGDGGSTDGIDENGVAFQTADGQDYVLYSQGGVFSVETLGTQYNGDVTVNSTNFVCYCTGARILTTSGEIPVEQLAVGDTVVTASGAERPIRWIGHRKIDCRALADPIPALPIRIAAGAFGGGKPHRDLWVSGAHAIGVDANGEILVPASALLNGSTIARVEVETVTYWHVELDSHDILVAEGLPAESYLEAGNRGFFQENGVVSLVARPEAERASAAPADLAFCRPFHTEGPRVEALRARLRLQAQKLGWRLDADAPFAGLHLLADGVRIEPAVTGLSASFEAPAAAREIQLVSETSCPRDVSDQLDKRQLGLCLKSLTIADGSATPRTVRVDDPAQCDGLHLDRDGRRRWTKGRVRISPDLWRGVAGTHFTLRVELARPALARWIGPARRMDAPALGALKIA